MDFVDNALALYEFAFDNPDKPLSRVELKQLFPHLKDVGVKIRRLRDFIYRHGVGTADHDYVKNFNDLGGALGLVLHINFEAIEILTEVSTLPNLKVASRLLGYKHKTRSFGLNFKKVKDFGLPVFKYRKELKFVMEDDLVFLEGPAIRKKFGITTKQLDGLFKSGAIKHGLPPYGNPERGRVCLDHLLDALGYDNPDPAFDRSWERYYAIKSDLERLGVSLA